MNRLYKAWWNFKIATRVVLLWYVVFAFLGWLIWVGIDYAGLPSVAKMVVLVPLVGAFLWKVGPKLHTKLPLTEEQIKQKKQKEKERTLIPSGNTNVIGTKCRNCGKSIAYSHEIEGGQPHTCSRCGEPLPDQQKAIDIAWGDEDDEW